MYEYESLYPDLHKKAAYFGVDLHHAAIIAMLGALAFILGFSTGSWFLLGVCVFYWAMTVRINDRTRFYDIRTRFQFVIGQQEFKW